ncbi:diacylglycerol kinase (ATP) [Moraxella cuniculi DSM 21768]|uniref:Diacylglycerol kinase n=2 Tax=Moraxella cuniculi TaxID=34061 RepID=A0A1N7F1Q9_9GAMM|nr:diacylglycerol kinase [Moraxella cuniculi]OOS05059.1 diacylglycerol kinase [Moraxella cuniculi]SIR94224.1 diacylglycerol kinase (ATP) [Moraxella cuniculi DSM 21768]VEG13789.1 Diacylglycerol kinase [Moraxella cuniculi]
MHSPQKGKTGIQRIINAANYSLAGLTAAYHNEAAFRQILWLNIVLIPLSWILPVTGGERALMIFVCLFCLIVELFNSAIEAVVDRISTEHHPLSGRAKDMGSAAQMIALTALVLVWVVILFDKFV